MKSGKKLDAFLDELIGEETTAGDLVRSSRKRSGLTQEDIKFICGIETTTQSSIENGKTPVTQKYAEIYAVIFGQHPTFFLYPDGFKATAEMLKMKKKAKVLLDNRKEQGMGSADRSR